MTNQTYNTMGIDVIFSVPTSIEEFDQNAKKTGAGLASAIDSIVYRGSLAQFRPKFCEAVEKETGIVRKTKLVTLKSKNEDGTAKTSEVWDGTEVEYFANVLAKTNRNAASFTKLAQSIADSIAFDASERVRVAAGPKKIGKAYLDSALKAQNEGKLEDLAAKLSKKLKRDVAATVETVAAGIKELMDAQAAAQMAALVN